MRWRKDPLEGRLGERRVVDRFLWFPKTLDGEVRWLERASVLQEVRLVDVGGTVAAHYTHRWVDIAWADSLEEGVR